MLVKFGVDSYDDKPYIMWQTLHNYNSNETKILNNMTNANYNSNGKPKP